MRRTLLNVFFGTMTLVTGASVAHAQSPASPAKLIVEPIQNGWLFSPDVRATEVDGETGALAGGYLGRMTDRSWVIGVGGYMLTDPDDTRKLWYGGPVFEWLIRADRKIGFGVRTLVGAGRGTLARPLSDFVQTRSMPSRDDRRGINPRGDLRLVNPDVMVAVQDDFYVAEPQLNVMWNLSAGQRIVFGVGYRAIGNAPHLGDALSGVSGSVSFQLGGK